MNVSHWQKLKSNKKYSISDYRKAMLLQIKRTLNETISSLKNTLSSCLQIPLPGHVKKSMHMKLNNVKSGIITIQDQLKILMGSIHYIEAKNQTLTQQKIRNSRKPIGKEFQSHLEKQVERLNTQMQIIKGKNLKLSKQIDFVKFSNHSLREQIKRMSPYKSDNQNMKTAMKGIQEQLMNDANKISSKINRMIKSSNLDYEQQQNLRARQKLSKFKNKKLSQLQQHNNFQFEIQDIINFDITPPMQIIQATQKKSINENSKRNNNLLREIYDLDNQAHPKKKGKSSTKEKKHELAGSNGNSKEKEKEKERKQQHSSVSKGISIKKSQELAKLVAEQTKIIQCKQRYLSTDLV